MSLHEALGMRDFMLSLIDDASCFISHQVKLVNYCDDLQAILTVSIVLTKPFLPSHIAGSSFALKLCTEDRCLTCYRSADAVLLGCDSSIHRFTLDFTLSKHDVESLFPYNVSFILSVIHGNDGQILAVPFYSATLSLTDFLLPPVPGPLELLKSESIIYSAVFSIQESSVYDAFLARLSAVPNL